MSVLPGAIYRFSIIKSLSEYHKLFFFIPSTFITELEQIILKFVWNQERPQIAKGMLKKKTKIGGITIPDLNCCKDVIIKAVWYWHRNRHIDQRNRTESPEM